MSFAYIAFFPVDTKNIELFNKVTLGLQAGFNTFTTNENERVVVTPQASGFVVCFNEFCDSFHTVRDVIASVYDINKYHHCLYIEDIHLANSQIPVINNELEFLIDNPCPLCPRDDETRDQFNLDTFPPTLKRRMPLVDPVNPVPPLVGFNIMDPQIMNPPLDGPRYSSPEPTRRVLDDIDIRPRKRIPRQHHENEYYGYGSTAIRGSILNEMYSRQVARDFEADTNSVRAKLFDDFQ